MSNNLRNLSSDLLFPLVHVLKLVIISVATVIFLAAQSIVERFEFAACHIYQNFKELQQIDANQKKFQQRQSHKDRLKNLKIEVLK